jgi:hypothetical protein
MALQKNSARNGNLISDEKSLKRRGTEEPEDFLQFSFPNFLRLLRFLRVSKIFAEAPTPLRDSSSNTKYLPISVISRSICFLRKTHGGAVVPR